MARPKKQITEDTFWTVGQYFIDKCKDYRTREELFFEDEDDYTAEKQLKFIHYESDFYRENRKLAVKALNAWCRKWVTPVAMKRMWAALRQKKFHQNKAKQQVTLDSMAHYVLKEYAKHHKLTLSEAIRQLVEIVETEYEDQ
jgi:macrodomain Ter protein organizer (MatP/YcbG family)